MAHKANHFATNYNPAANRSQPSQAINEMGSLLGNMALGPDPSDDALFRNRLLQGQGYQLANRGTRSRLDSADAMAGLDIYGSQNARNMGLDPSKMSPEDILKFAAQMAYSDKQNALALSHRNTSGSIADQRQSAQNLTNSQSLADVILQNKNLLGDKTVQETLNLADLQTNLDAQADANILNTEALRRQIEEQTEGIKLGTGEGGRKERLTEADIGVKGATKENIQTSTDQIIHKMGLSEMLTNQEVQNRISARENAKQLRISQVGVNQAKIEEINASKESSRELVVEQLNKLKSSTSLNWAGVDKIVADIGNNELIAAQKALKLQAETVSEEEYGQARADQIRKDIKRIEEIINNLKSTDEQQKKLTELQVEKGGAEIDLINQRMFAVEDKAYDSSQVADATTRYWERRGEGEVAKTMLTGAKTANQKAGKQDDFRKTEAFQRVGRKVADEGVAYTGTKKADEWGWQDDLEEFTTHVWPDDDKKLRGLMLPFPTDKAEQAKRMEAGKLFLSKAGDYDEDSQRVILKSILQVK